MVLTHGARDGAVFEVGLGVVGAAAAHLGAGLPAGVRVWGRTARVPVLTPAIPAIVLVQLRASVSGPGTDLRWYKGSAGTDRLLKMKLN